MIQWLIPASLFWTLAALYLGGMSVDAHGGNGLRQLVGLLVTYALFMALWGVLRLIPPAGTLVDIVAPTALSIVAMPLLARAGFLVVGVKLRPATGH